MTRIYQHGDHEAIAEIFTSAIHQIASEVYTPEQCLAWSDRMPNHEHWRKRCELKRPFVAVMDSTIAGFLELNPDGHIDCAYISPKFKRRGIMTGLVQHPVSTCFALNISRVYVEASICAKPLFEKCGFQVLCENVVNLKGIELVNYKMERLRALADWCLLLADPQTISARHSHSRKALVTTLISGRNTDVQSRVGKMALR